MAELAEYRVYKRKRIKNPADESQYVDIPVLYEARFKMAANQATEFYVYFDNSENASREVHVRRVVNNEDDSQYVDVERIDEWTVKVVADQAQESTFVMTNTDPPPMQPDGSNNPSHEQTHIVRYYMNNDAGTDIWVDVELIDCLKIKCVDEQEQEYLWYLKHPELGDQVSNSRVSYAVTAGYCDLSFELVSS